MNYKEWSERMKRMVTSIPSSPDLGWKPVKVVFEKERDDKPVEYKQLIIARKDLNMPPGKLAAQVAHASMAFLATMIRKGSRRVEKQGMDPWDWPRSVRYDVSLVFGQNMFENWLNGSFTKVVCRAKNKNDLEKAIKLARDMGLQEGTDYFLIRDKCLTELKPEENGTTLTCIGFKPMPKEDTEKISKHFQLYK